jgi:transposase
MTDIQQIVASYSRCGSLSQVARELHISRNTVKRYLRRVEEVRCGIQDEILPKDRKIQQPRRSVTDELLFFIHSLLEENLSRPKKQRMNGRQIHTRTVQMGYSIGYSTVRQIIAAWNKTKSPREVFILQKPEPGYRAEFDWCEVNLQIKGIWTKVHMVVMVLTFSLYRFARLYQHETQQEVLDAHIKFFNEIQSVPHYIYYDNLRAVYDYTRKVFQDKYLQFASHYGFSYEVCNPASPHEKGTDEESVSHIRTNAFGERVNFESLEEAQEWLQTTLVRLNSNSVYRRSSTPIDGLKEEQPVMIPLPTMEYSNYLTKSAKISKYSLVTFDRNHYSIPDTYRQKHILLKASVDKIDFVAGQVLIASHQRLYGKGQYSLNICHYLKTLSRKPGSLKHSMVIHQVHETLQKLFETHYYDRTVEFLNILRLIADFSFDELLTAVECLQKNHITPEYDTLRLILTRTPIPSVESLEVFDQVRVTPTRVHLGTILSD